MEKLVDFILPIAFILVSLGLSARKNKGDLLNKENTPKDIQKRQIPSFTQKTKKKPETSKKQWLEEMDKRKESMTFQKQEEEELIAFNEEQVPQSNEKDKGNKMDNRKGEEDPSLGVFSEDPIINGLIYAEILSKPKSLRKE